MSDAAGEAMLSEEPNALVEANPMQAEIMKLRRRWELASVLNFLDVRFSGIC